MTFYQVPRKALNRDRPLLFTNEGKATMKPEIRKKIELWSWIATIAALFVAVYSLLKPPSEPPKAADANPPRHEPSTQIGTTIIGGDGKGNAISSQNVVTGDVGGSSIGNGTGNSNVVVNNNIAAPAPPVVPKVPTKAKLVAFNVNSNGGYWTRAPSNRVSRVREKITYTYGGTEYWSELASCLEMTSAPKDRARCGDSKKILPIFDVTLAIEGDEALFLNEIRAVLVEGSTFQGSAGEVPRAAVPLSASYQLRLADADKIGKGITVKLGAVPPLMLEKHRPARFELVVVPKCIAECSYVLRLQFIFSNDQIVSTNLFTLDFAQSGGPPDERSRIPKDLR
jgi:hypothetical protein